MTPLSRPARAQGNAPTAGSAAASLGQLVEVPGGRPVPELAFTDGEGAPKSLASFAGQGVVLNLWATWCPPCVAEMPALDRLQAMLQAEGIVVVPLSSDRGGRAQVAPFYAARGLKHLGMWLDPRGAVGRALGVRGLPTTLVLDRQGRERARLEGAADWDSAPLAAAIRRLVAAGDPAGDKPAAT
ncbi:TlpA family protein disulfide reductase [Roseomonas sp. OT10]|uniref:TlpA family protein disulfide reductase n=1 Tax=Roseomonas cutis TaxID=2897332 RepID=UPI001E40CC36|nr:TlpA disulfide reductase family protein [Roseomonas sp. OT10]UFN47733.1 TlpA family protein disulfide reductase [Roseomonas sp. OT10]